MSALAPEAFAFALMHASLRTGAALALLPALGGQMIPVRVRIGLAGAIGLLVMDSGWAPPVPAEMLGLRGVALVAGELLIGAVAALALHAAFAAAAVAGEWLAQGMGLAFATQIDPAGAPAPVLSGLFALLMWAILLAAGGHLLLIELIVASYRAMPTAAALFEPARLAAIAGWGGLALASGLIAALPLGVALLLVNLAIGVAARSAPQLNLFSIGFPLALLAGLAGLPLALPALADSLTNTLLAMQGQVQQVLLG